MCLEPNDLALLCVSTYTHDLEEQPKNGHMSYLQKVLLFWLNHKV